MPMNSQALQVFCKFLKYDFYKNHKNTIAIQNYILNMNKQKLFFRGKILTLTKKEFHFLRYIFLNANTIISYYTLDEIFWSNCTTTSSRRSFLCRLRQKLPFLQITIKRDIGLGVFEEKYL